MSAIEPQRRLGWIQPSAKPDVKRFNLAYAQEFLSEEQWKEFSRITSILARTRPYVIDMTSLASSYSELDNLEEQLKNFTAEVDLMSAAGGSKITDLYSTAQRKLDNLLTGCSAFRDRTIIRIKEDFGDASTELKTLDSQISRIYEHSRAYRIGYYLRNYSQHHESPLDFIPFKTKLQEDGSYKSALSLYLRSDVIIEKAKPLVDRKKINKKFLIDLQRTEPEIGLHRLMTEYVQALGQIFIFIMQIHRTEIEEYEAYIKYIHKNGGIPETATPVIFEGETPSFTEVSVGYNSKFHSFSLYEYQLLKTLYVAFSKDQIPRVP